MAEFALSHRDLDEFLAGTGLAAAHTSRSYWWVQRFTTRIVRRGAARRMATQWRTSLVRASGRGSTGQQVGHWALFADQDAYQVSGCVPRIP